MSEAMKVGEVGKVEREMTTQELQDLATEMSAAALLLANIRKVMSKEEKLSYSIAIGGRSFIVSGTGQQPIIREAEDAINQAILQGLQVVMANVREFINREREV
jgi:hypothetical protein